MKSVSGNLNLHFITIEKLQPLLLLPNSMTKELILFIAYKACQGRDVFFEKNPFQYQNALRLIGLNILLHIIQLILLFKNKAFFLLEGQLSGIHYISLAAGFFVVMFLVKRIFSKRILAKAIKQYNDSISGSDGKWIAFSYLFFNILLLSWLAASR